MRMRKKQPLFKLATERNCKITIYYVIVKVLDVEGSRDVTDNCIQVLHM